MAFPLDKPQTGLFTDPRDAYNSEVLLEFRAGKITKQDSKMVPDARKGALQVVRSEEDLIHVRWLDRTTRTILEDTIVFPEESRVIFSINNRCLCLSFRECPERNLHFWMQEPKAETDDIIIQSLNQHILAYLESPPIATSQHTVPLQAPSPILVGAHDMDTSMANVGDNSALINASMLAAALGGAPISATSISPATSAGAMSAPFSSSMLAAALGNALTQGGASSGGGSYSQVAPGPSLADVLRPDELRRLLANEAATASLAEHLPEEHRSHHQILELPHSPHFMQQVESFSRALQTGQIDLTQFNLPAGTGFSVAEFLEAIQRQVEE
mmetsp:Transcript_5692/g.7688  ORF Transcript_5692/g.7688 Transcript_5692/m.7688 type:complete len:329 (+) Transcript_5692:206-1192(+)|eukprot:CAMPEP_0196575134 /NCGR_PEP_ID=MMETSP1081-20130531/4679_1 /TAXON_ID=36882 /ORGANISM="Pyramimonas amylifera, Strain CCMP720" /LENGTH=328 /DNA_ID=CAMNT_0041893337 /DNA_START=203 /DNA_END=1189 /DNA_ORIENTATION=+